MKIVESTPTNKDGNFKLHDYMGTWYEISAFPQIYQRGCINSQATYELIDDTNFKVLNQCDLMIIGKKSKFDTTAKVLDNSSVPQIYVRNPLFNMNDNKANYIVLLTDYKNYAIVGSPDKKSLWILSRDKNMDKDLYLQLVNYAEQQGYDINKLVLDDQKSIININRWLQVDYFMNLINMMITYIKYYFNYFINFSNTYFKLLVFLFVPILIILFIILIYYLFKNNY